MIIWHNGEFKEDAAPILSIHDRVRLGEGVFNTILVIDGDIKHAQIHMQKILKNSEVFLGKWDKPTEDFLIQMAQQLLHKNSFLNGTYALNTYITCGPSGGGIRTPQSLQPQIFMRALPFKKSEEPVHAIIAQSTRRNEGSPLSNIKCCNYGDNIFALREAQNKGANEAILLNNKGHVSCASVANILSEKDGKLYTPPLSDGCQDGITRAIAREKYNVIERSFTADELKSSDGIYLLNSLRGALPVVSLDGDTLPVPTIKIPQDFHIT